MGNGAAAVGQASRLPACPRSHPGTARPAQALKLSPHEQLEVAFGFLTLNPPPCKAST